MKRFKTFAHVITILFNMLIVFALKDIMLVGFSGMNTRYIYLKQMIKETC